MGRKRFGIIYAKSEIRDVWRDEMETELISVIVPVYNVQNFIKECIESILTQTVSSFELILVDDGSKDESGKICDIYKEKDDRIRVFHQKNGGLSSARNKGLDEAKGNYICFVDADDTVRSDFLEKLYDAVISDNSELAICDVDAPKLEKADRVAKTSAVMNSRQAEKWLYDLRTREYVLMVIACNKMFSKELFDDIRFPIGKLHEDEFVIGPILSECKTVSYVSEKLYIYRDNESGITSDSNRMNIKHLDGVDALVQRTLQAMDENNYEFALTNLKNSLYKCAGFYRDSGTSGYEEMKSAAFSKYREIYSEFKRILSIKQRAKYGMFMVFPYVFIKVYNP